MGQAGECVRTHFVCRTGLKCMDDVRTAEVLVCANQIIIESKTVSTTKIRVVPKHPVGQGFLNLRSVQYHCRKGLWFYNGNFNCSSRGVASGLAVYAGGEAFPALLSLLGWKWQLPALSHSECQQRRELLLQVVLRSCGIWGQVW